MRRTLILAIALFCGVSATEAVIPTYTFQNSVDPLDFQVDESSVEVHTAAIETVLEIIRDRGDSIELKACLVSEHILAVNFTLQWELKNDFAIYHLDSDEIEIFNEVDGSRSASGLSPTGVVYGFNWGVTADEWYPHWFRYQSGKGFQFFSSINSERLVASVTDMDARGVAVGTCYAAAGITETYASLWLENGQCLDLNDCVDWQGGEPLVLLKALALNKEGWILVQAQGAEGLITACLVP